MWSTSKISQTYSRKSKSRRRRRGRKSLVHTRFRSDPWQSSPPKTPPSSDDENDGNMCHSTQSSSSSYRGEHIMNLKKTNRNEENKIQSNIKKNKTQTSSPSSFTRRIQSVAPTPMTTNAGTDIANNSCSRYSNEVKMENLHILQSAKCTRTHKQTKLNVKKTAPVPLPFAIGVDEVIQGKKLKSKAITSKAKQSKQKQHKTKQKHTGACAAPGSFVSSDKIHSKNKNKTDVCVADTTHNAYKTHSSSNAALMNRIAELATLTVPVPTVVDPMPTNSFPIDYQAEYNLPTNQHYHTSSVQNQNSLKDLRCENERDVRIDFPLIPEAYYIDFDSNMEVLTTNSEEESIESFPIPVKTVAGPSPSGGKTLPMIIDDESHSDNKHCNANDLEIAVIQKDVNAALRIAKEKRNEIRIDSMYEEQNAMNPNTNMKMNTKEEEVNVKRDHEEEVYFDDWKFSLLAEQILEEKTPSVTFSNNHNEHATLSYKKNNNTAFNLQAYDAHDGAVNFGEVAQVNSNSNSNSSSFMQPQQPVQTSFGCNQRHNIWSEPWDCQYTYNYSANHSATTTLGDLLMNGFPPIKKELFH